MSLPIERVAFPEEADEGDFVAYGPSIAQFFVKVTEQVIKLLRGDKPADIPYRADRQCAWHHGARDISGTRRQR